jgi:hypothetical protein
MTLFQKRDFSKYHVYESVMEKSVQLKDLSLFTNIVSNLASTYKFYTSLTFK